MGTPAVPLWLISLALGVLCNFVPAYTRPDLFFGVTVVPAFRSTDAARRILRNFRVALWCLTVPATAAAFALDRPIVVLILYMAGVFGAFMIAHSHAVEHRTSPVSIFEIDLAAPHERFPGGLIGALLPFALLLGLGAWVAFHADRLPERLVVHSGLTGPDRWVITSPRTVFAALASAGFFCLVLSLTAFGVLHRSRRISASGPGAASERRFRRHTVLFIIACEYFVVFLAAVKLLQMPRLLMLSSSAAFAAILVALIVGLVRAGQGGTRAAAVSRETPVGDRTPDDRWKWSLLYFNRKDPALLVEKRMGIGYTLNFGNPWSWVLVTATLASPWILCHI